ncbi:MAG TPA: L,D-transpeptidase family protein, partial [Ottowia sp.]|nr:L,D-transpeptidase family protein [Ottowia sp.]
TPVPALPGHKLQGGQRWAGLATLAARLHALGDLGAAPATDPDTFDPALQDAVKAFQERHGLSADGVLGKATLEALDVPPAARARQIALALERLRLTPLPAAERFVTVNVPEFMLYAWQRQDQAVHQAFAMRVIVGKAVGTRTPLFDEDMRRIEFNPYWNIPPSIARGETLPKLRANPGYLAAQGMEFVGPGGQTSSAVTAELLDAVQAGQWRLRQRPGRLNALGDIKFVLPNDQNIYLHHTPSVGLFQRARRDFSHGCIRIEQPVALAQWVLADDPDWSEARIRQTMGQPRTVSVALPTPVPVLIVYRTVSVRDGRVHFAPDLYRQDALLERALAQRPHPARGPGPVRGAS